MRNSAKLILAVYPNARGFAFVLFEEQRLVDWGIVEASAKEREEHSFRKINKLIQRFRPDTLVLREEAKSRQGALFQRIMEIARDTELPTSVIARKEVRRAFASLSKPTRRAIVAEIVERFPMLRLFDPGPRKIWDSEKRQMGLFDATALVLAFFVRPIDPPAASLMRPA